MANKNKAKAPLDRHLDVDSRHGLDEIDSALLKALSETPRASVADLARRVRMSAPAVRDRIARLEANGVIRGMRLDIDPAKIGLPVAAWVRVKPGPGQLGKVAELARGTPEISECYRISGEDCFLMQVHVAAIEDLEEVLDRFLMYGQTTSSFVVATPVPKRTVLGETRLS